MADEEHWKWTFFYSVEGDGSKCWTPHTVLLGNLSITHTHTDPDRSVLQMQRGRMPCVEEEGKHALIMLLMLLLQKPIDYMYCLVTTIKREINKFISHLTTLHCMQSMYMHCIAGWWVWFSKADHGWPFPTNNIIVCSHWSAGSQCSQTQHQ